MVGVRALRFGDDAGSRLGGALRLEKCRGGDNGKEEVHVGDRGSKNGVGAGLWTRPWSSVVQTRRYSPGTIRCAVVVPAFMIHAPPEPALSGRPVLAVVAPGSATVMCGRV